MLIRQEHFAQKGYFTFAINTLNVDYLSIAYLQALSIKKTQKINCYAIAVDAYTFSLIEDKHREIFDYIIEIPNSEEIEDPLWKLGNEWKAYWLTPFKETFKLDADITFNRNIDHWWNTYQIKDVLMCNQVVDYTNTVSNSMVYRKLFVENKLPNLYSGFMYFRYSRPALEFFELARELYHNWDTVRNSILINCRDDYPTTDVVYALTAKLLGEENFYLPESIVPRIAHMKGAIQGWNMDVDWMKKLYSEIDEEYNHQLGFHRQLYPVHYINKSYATNGVIEKYERS